MAWKKIINDGDGLSALADINTSGVAQNEVLIYDGTGWVAAESGTTFNFYWASANYATNVDTVLDVSVLTNYNKLALIGTKNTAHITSLTATLGYDNPGDEGDWDSGRDADGDDGKGLQYSYDGTSSWSDIGDLAWNGGDPTITKTSITTIKYPNKDTNAAWNDSTDANAIRVSYFRDSVIKDHYVRYKYRNAGYYMGLHTDTAVLNQTEIKALASQSVVSDVGGPGEDGSSGGESVLWNGAITSASDEGGVDTTGFALDDTTRYVHLYVPTRCTDVPTFYSASSSTITDSEDDWTPLGNVSVTNTRGFVEEYKGWVKPEGFDNTSITNIWVKIDFVAA